MQGCWAAALDETANMATALKIPEAEVTSSSQYCKEPDKHIFWNPQKKYYSYGMNKDRTFRTEATVLPAVPLYFKFGNTEKAKPVLDQLASNAFRPTGDEDHSRRQSFLQPTGYHYGSVWPYLPAGRL